MWNMLIVPVSEMEKQTFGGVEGLAPTNVW